MKRLASLAVLALPLALLLVPLRARAAADPFGVNELYPTAAGGRQWFSTWNNGVARAFDSSKNDPQDPWFQTAGMGNASYSVDGNGLFYITGATPRMYIMDPQRAGSWHNVEMTVYAYRVVDSSTPWGGIEGVARTNHTADTVNYCDTRGNDARFRYDGHIDFEKETHHPDSVAVQNKKFFANGLPYKQWIGYKLVVYDLPNGDVKLESWMDLSDGSGGGSWTKVNEIEDTGSNFGVGGTPCAAGIDPALRLTNSASRPGSETGNPNLSVYWRSDNVGPNGLVYKKMSVREIDPSLASTGGGGSQGSTAGPTTWYVAATGSDANAGTSAAPFATLQAGVDAARPGDTVLVGDGTYGPTGGSGSFGVTIAKAGTAAAPITLEAEHAGAAVLDCQGVCHSYIDLGSGSAYWVIKGFDIKNGYWGGIFANSSAAQNIVVRGNSIHNIGNRTDSSATGITGIYTDAGAANWTIDGNVFHDIGRTAVLDGRHDHAIYTHGGAMTIVNNKFYGLLNGWDLQTADGFSGTIAGNTFYGADPVGGIAGQVMLWGADGPLTIRDNVFYGANATGITTYALTVSGACAIDHNLAYTPGSSVSVTGGAPAGCAESSELLNEDPKLLDPAAYDFHLAAGSPAIGAGAPVAALTEDFDGNPRPQSSAPDLGAFEYVSSGSGGSGAPPPPPPQPPNVALNKELDASSSIGAGGTPDLANDNDLGTAWTAGPGDGQWLLADLGTPYALTGAVLHWGAVYAASYQLQASSDAASWSTVYAANAGAGGDETVSFATATARYLRVLELARSGAGGVSLRELELRGAAPAGADVAPPSITGINTTITASAASDGLLRVAWNTNEPADTRLDYGPTRFYGLSAPTDPALTTSHSVVVGPFPAGTVYHYRVASRDAAGNLARSSDMTATIGPSVTPVTDDNARAPQRFLSPAIADGVNDAAVFGPAAADVSIRDLQGHEVFHGSSAGGGIVWNGRDGSGRVVPSGVYLARIKRSDGKRLYQSLAVAK